MSSISIIAYIVLTISIGYTFIYSSVGDLSILMDEKQDYENSLETVNNIENKKSELLTQFNKISAEDKKDIDTILPDSLNFVRLVSQIDSVAANYNISIDKVSSKETSDPAGGMIGDGQPQRMYNSAIISFSFVAPYSQFNSFIDGLEKSLRILDIKYLKLTTQEDGNYLYDIEFETYWLKPL